METKLEGLLELSEAIEKGEVNDGEKIRSCLKELQDYRIRNHALLSVNPTNPENGITVDVLFFTGICMCIHLLPKPEFVNDWYSNPVVTNLVDSRILNCLDSAKPRELSYAFALMFHWQRHLDWQSKGVRKMISCLEWRCACIMGEHRKSIDNQFPSTAESPWFTSAQEFYTTRTLWACATARCKIACIAASNRVHSPPGGTSDFPEPEVTIERLKSWLVDAVDTWNGPRLREAMSKAYKRLDLRFDETGRVCAFNGDNVLERARGSMDTIEQCLHEIDVHWVIQQVDSSTVASVIKLSEIMTLKLVHNAIEANTAMDWLGGSVYLLNNRKCGALHEGQYSIGSYIVETTGGWVVVAKPTEAKAAPGPPMSLIMAVCSWYSLTFNVYNDPLQLFQ